MQHKVVIVGSGPAGYTAAIYLGRAGLDPVMVTGALTPGGQLVNTTEVENFPGFPKGIMGPELMDNMRAQAKRFGTEFIADDVVAIKTVEPPTDGQDSARPNYRLNLSDGDVLQTEAVIIATGSNFRKLCVPGEQELSGHGVSYCATCDGFFFRDKPIVVVGGGDSAFEEALFLTRFGSSVTLIHRRDEFRASQIMVDRAKENPKLRLLTNTVVTEVHGTETAPAAAPAAPAMKLGGLSLTPKPQVNVSSVSLKNTVTGEESELETAAVFVAIGHTPATDFAADVVNRDADGYITVDGASTRTSAAGIFAAGDCVDRVYRQAISAAGMGCRAALDAQAYLND
ncbi:NAD(P)/FAD-dependent oxidoreductase [Bifidobacterium sp. UTCIF-36]|uniref:NAD(P)/FAD-dependent oxidoreductase n=1 Tax=Bifidobacterium sp. UTCIF-36 TaxID=1465258 RepID=UPI00112D6BE2|nr:thioredoxin-disulfide reductase [Bifidobacterium sp. UTCIF-36]TPF83586.1 thioredoxin reductase [Bifidobacterium sp. UTCIF-36]